MLIDFGAVKEVETMMVNSQGQTSLSVAIGSLGYMPNEQAAGRPKLSSDIYAVGMLGIQALTGRQPQELPIDPTTDEVIWRNWANVSDKLADVLNKMVSYYFRNRYPSAVEALAALKSPQPQQQQVPQPQQQVMRSPLPAPTKIITPWSRRKVIQTVGFAGAGLGLAIIIPRLSQPNSKEVSISDIATTSEPTDATTPQPTDVPSTTSPTSSNSLQTFQFEVVSVNAQGSITNRRNGEAKQFVEDLGNGVTLEMVQIPGGTFTMGSPAGEAERESDESPQHQVTVPGFFMGRYAVTQAQYQAIMGTNPANFKGEKRPVEKVSWDDAVEFCKKLSEKTGKTYGLPSEAEWEYACRAGTTTPFYFGETITTDLVNYNGNYPYGSAPKGEYRNQTTNVGIFPPNSFGLYDLHGNIWEWCQDVYNDNENYQGAPRDGSAWLTGKDNDIKRLRGGSWLNNAGYCRCANRDGYARAYRGGIVGFRLVAVAVP